MILQFHNKVVSLQCSTPKNIYKTIGKWVYFYILIRSYFCKDIGYQFPLNTHISMSVFVLWREWRLDSLLLCTQISFRNAKEQ